MEDQVFIQHLRARLMQKPHQHIINHILKTIPGVLEYSSYSFGYRFIPELQSFTEVDELTIEKVQLEADISLLDDRGKCFNDDFKKLLF